MKAQFRLAMALMPCLILQLGCPEDGDSEGAAQGGPGQQGQGSTNGGIADGTLGGGGGAHDCGGSFRVSQDDIQDGVPLSGSIICASCTGSVTVRVLDLPPDQGGSEGEPCITQATFEAAGDFSMKLPAGLSAVNIVTVDDGSTDWGLQEKVPVSDAGATGVELVVGDKPAGTPQTSAGETLPEQQSGQMSDAEKASGFSGAEVDEAPTDAGATEAGN